MTNTVTGLFQSTDQARNLEDDLIAAGVPREQIVVNEGAKKIHVSVPAATQPGILEMFARHGVNAE